MKVEVEWQDVKTLIPLLERGDEIAFLLIDKTGEGVIGVSFKTLGGSRIVTIDGDYLWELEDLEDTYTKWCLFPFPRDV